jgi:hypothetical protein
MILFLGCNPMRMLYIKLFWLNCPIGIKALMLRKVVVWLEGEEENHFVRKVVVLRGQVQFVHLFGREEGWFSVQNLIPIKNQSTGK